MKEHQYDDIPPAVYALMKEFAALYSEALNDPGNEARHEKMRDVRARIEVHGYTVMVLVVRNENGEVTRAKVIFLRDDQTTKH